MRRANRTFLLVVGLLVPAGCRDMERFPELPIAPHPMKLSATNVMGCYEVSAFQWPPGTPTNLRAVVLPRLLILQSYVLTSPWFEHPIAGRDPAPDRGGSWRLTSEGELRIEWYRRGSSALSIEAHRPSWTNALFGRAEVRDEPRFARVVMESIPCWPGADFIGTPERVYTTRPLS
jgi:hypothetical protein